MTTIEARIPAFSMWKMFNDTIPALFKLENCEGNVERLGNIIKSDEFSNIFVYNHDPLLTLQEYESISTKYKSFTVWLLGRFFYLLSSEKLVRIHDTIVEAQLRILHLMSVTQPHIYRELAAEYCAALRFLKSYLKDCNDVKLNLKVFVPQQHTELIGKLDLNPTYIEVTSRTVCLNILRKIVRILGKILRDNFETHYLNKQMHDFLSDLLYVVEECDLALKLDVLNAIFESLFHKKRANFPLDFAEHIDKFAAGLEQLTYEILNGKLELGVKEKDSFESAVNKFMDGLFYSNTDSRKTRICEFILTRHNLSKELCSKCGVLIRNFGEFTGDVDGLITEIFTNNKTYLMCFLERELKTNENSRAALWQKIIDALKENWRQSDCKTACTLRTQLHLFEELSNMQMRLRLNTHYPEFLEEFLKSCNNHFGVCVPVAPELFLSALVSSGLFCFSQHLNLIFKAVLHAFKLPVEPPPNSFKKSYTFLSSQKIETILALQTYSKFLDVLLVRDLELKHGLKSGITSHLSEITENFLTEATAFTVVEISRKTLILARCTEGFALDRYFQLIQSTDSEVVRCATAVLSQVICLGFSSCFVSVRWDEVEKTTINEVLCCECYNSKPQDEIVRFGPFHAPNQDVALKVKVLKLTRLVLAHKTPAVKLNVMKALVSCSKHLDGAADLAKSWTSFIADENKDVRQAFANVVFEVFQGILNNNTTAKERKEEFLLAAYTTFKSHTKQSLQYSRFDLQETILQTLSNLTAIKSEMLLPHILDLLLYFVMIPTSKHALMAVNTCLTIEKKHKTKIKVLYTKFRKDLCKTIVELCAVNQALIGSSLQASLQKVGMMLGFFSTKDFVSQECEYMLPILVALSVTMPRVKELIREMADLVGLDVPQLLASKYGSVLLHIYLKEAEDVCKKAMLFLERETGMSGPVLRKNNFRVILNELLLNFYDNQRQVVELLKLLMQEDDQESKPSKNIQDYLQPRLLGVLLYFDRKLEKQSEQKNALLSLQHLLKFMGAKNLSSMRFKIIAMLRTALRSKDGGFPDLVCSVWETFVTSCDVDALGPQLATIFVSLLPLLDRCPHLVNAIFRYLVVKNEQHLQENIRDLFFVTDARIEGDVGAVIARHTQKHNLLSFKEQLDVFGKYLNHETVDVRLHGLRYIKDLVARNREELDQMILGYNGIDPAVVALVDALMSGCREKDKDLKLMCAEVFGELGAIEPSHLPRRYAEQSQSFTFFVHDEGFVISVLTELIRALQAEVKTQNLDRYSLAIQEILKVYGVSPNENSAGCHIWKQFSEVQQELMRPLLSSKYMNMQPNNFNFNTPLYGSSDGASFNSWIYNWTCSLVSMIQSEKKTLLHACLPSMKEDRILMAFLPHILLHALLEGSTSEYGRIYTEMVTVINSFNRRQKLDEEILEMRPLRPPDVVPHPQPVTPEEVKQKACTRVVFILLDFLDRWTREWLWQKGLAGQQNSEYRKINEFLRQFSKMQLASCNYHCGEYPRALMYFEEYITEHPDQMTHSLSFLAELFARLDEPDGVAGVMAIQQAEPSIEQRILALEVSGKLADAAACYERAAQPLKLEHLKGLIRCYLDLDNVNTALNIVQGVLKNQPEFGDSFWELQAEPLWRLSRYDDLGELLERPELSENNSWGVQIGRTLLSYRSGKSSEFQTVIEELRQQQVEALGTATLEEGAYQHGYGYISRLHALNEMQRIEKMTNVLLSGNNSTVEDVVKQVVSEWELRLKVVQESVKITEPILCLRRVMLNEAKERLKKRQPSVVPLIDSLLGECWLTSAKTARQASLHQQAYTYTLKAEEYAPATLFLEKAKLHWLREEHEQALTVLRRGLEKILPEGSSGSSSNSNSSDYVGRLTLEERKICAEAKLLIASYNDTVSNVDTNTNIHHYKSAVETYREWEKSLVHLAQYYDRVFTSLSEEDRDAKGSDMQIHMINYFGKSLQYGSSYVYQSMPRLLSIWFDYGTRLLDVANSSIREERRTNLLKMTRLVDSFLERLPAYIFLTAFSQLVSRICHPQKEVYVELKAIIIKLLLQYPQQTLWMIISVVKSSYDVRAKRCAEIFNDTRLKTQEMTTLIRDFTGLAEKLMELCNKQIQDHVNKTTVSALLRTLPRMLAKSDFSEIMIPTHKFRKLVLPNPDFKSSQHNPFPNHYVHIVGIEDEVTVLASLQRPRKITLKGSDGKKYIQMLKPKDDLRKDFRLMEFNDIVNQLLSREAEARQRRLNIRLYSVAPLNEECGLIEWVPDLIGLRPVLMTLYKQKGMQMKGRELKELSCNLRDPLTKKRDVFMKKLLPRHPPVLGEWFRRTFPDAQTWLTARTAYTRTTAVMSIVGYILGLGDRHGENILLDSTCGDVVHVDFNCLFNKGETFEWPERVPFRLTQNMVAAMGPLGVEGVFRRSCAVTLRVLRTNTNTLMSIVTPFVYDPLVSWPRNVAASSSAQNAERTNEQAVEHVKNIELRLQGIMKVRSRSFSIPLSVDGQTNNLIKEAMSVDNLCQMYIGWGPYL